MDIDYFGNDIDNGQPKKTDSAKDCQQLCQKDNECVSFSWINKNVPDGSLVGRERECFIKSTKANRMPLKHVVSGPKYCGNISLMLRHLVI